MVIDVDVVKMSKLSLMCFLMLVDIKCGSSGGGPPICMCPHLSHYAI